MFVADDLEQVRGESASSEPVRFLLIAFAPSVAQPLVLLDRLRVHPRLIVVHPLLVDLLLWKLVKLASESRPAVRRR